MESTSLLCLLPTLVVLVLAILSKRTVEPLLAGCLVGLLMLSPSTVIPEFSRIMLRVMADETIGWVIMVCGLMGSLIALLVKSGGAIAFGQMTAKKISSRNGALLSAWMLGLVIFIDDYLNTLTISSSMKRLTDKYRVSRQMLAYVVDSTAAPICVLIPMSTWAVYFIAILEESLSLNSGQGFNLYLQAIPYMFYAWVAALFVPMLILNKLPLIGPMRKAEVAASSIEPIEDKSLDENTNNAWLTFFLPIGSLIFFTWWMDNDILKGVIVSLLITITVLWWQKKIKVNDIFDSSFDGFKSMLLPLATVVAGFMLKEVNDLLGLTDFIIDAIKPLLSAQLLPLVVFLSMAGIAFATGSFWGIFAVAVPIVLPLAISLEANIPLVIGALISASTFGSHSCFYGDSTVLAAHGSGCTIMEHALTQLPYALLAAVVSSVLFIGAGFYL